jgi:hypothetical protein
MRLTNWYKILLLSWALVGIPAFVLGWGFAGHAPWLDIPMMFEPGLFDPISILFTVAAWVFLLSPVLFAPVGISRKPKD